MRGLVEFDLSSLMGADIRSATLTLSADTTSINVNQLSTLSGSNESIVRRVTSAWTEAGVTWNTQPTTTAEDEVHIPSSSGSPSSFSIDVTKLVTIMARPGMNKGFMIQLATEQYYRAMRFVSSDDPNVALRPKLQVDYLPRCGDQPTLFCEVAYVGAPTCSDTDYSRIDNCYNNCNPPYPNSLRPTSEIESNNSNQVVPFTSDYVQTNAAPGANAVLPFARTSNDGRISINGGCRGCEGTNLQVFRPENLTHDAKLKTSEPPLPKGERGVVHPFVYYNPLTSKLPGITSNGRFPNANHGNICDVSGAAVSDDLNDAALGVLSKKGRNPVACQAHYDVSGDATPSADVKGDCYDLTLLYDLESDGVWEMRTVDVTVFVLNPKRTNTLSSGNGFSMWIYPRNPSGEVKTATSWRLPAYLPFNPHASNWSAMNTAPVDWGQLLTTEPTMNCYTQAKPPVRNPAGPKWCEFFDRQKQANSFNIDLNQNATMGDGFQWNGSSCGGAQSGAPGSCAAKALFEPTTTADGMLLIANVDGLQYSYNTAGPCRADGWTKFLPISFMPMDPNIYQHYDIGRTQRIGGVSRPFRDTMGNEIPFGALNGGAYVWIDRHGKNLFFSEANNPRDGYFARRAITAKNAIKTAAQYPPSTDADRAMMNPDRSPGMRQTVVGAWTQGKMVVLDGGQNISDIGGFRSEDPADWGNWHYDMRLFSGPDYANMLPRATSIVNSFENQLNYLDGFRPTLPFDVVWTMQSNTQRNTEVVFDEYLRNDAFVVAHMNAPTKMDTPQNRGTTFVKDGFTASNPSAYVRGGAIADFRFRENPLLQNAATSDPQYQSGAVRPPTTLRVRGGARVEPLGVGGVLGKGLYLDGLNDFVDMGYQIDTSRENWYLGVWLENRDESAQGIPRTVFFFSDNSWVGIEQADTGSVRKFSIVAYDGVQKRTQKVNVGTLIQTGKYFHFGMKLTPVPHGGRRLGFYIDGTPVGDVSFLMSDVTSDPMFGKLGFNVMYNSMGNGWTWMTLGDPGPSFVPDQVRGTFRGWTDELRIYALSDGDASSPWTEEFICNTALGTLVDIAVRSGETSDARLSALRAKASNNPLAPSAMCEQMKLGTYTGPNDFPSQYDQGLCIDRVHKNPRSDASLAARCLREQRLGIAGRPLVADSPRPEFGDVAFCQSCHHGEAKIGGLLLGALGVQPGLQRWQDPRRQPLNRPATLSGTMPAWFTTGLDLSDRTRTFDQMFDSGRALP